MTDPIIAAARFLQAHLDWLRHRSATEIQDCFADIAAAARVVAGIARGPSEQKYLGPCGAVVVEPETDESIVFGDRSSIPIGTCEGDVYGRAGAATGTCRTCEATVDQAERRAWLDSEVRQYAYTASEIAEAYPIKRNTINQWASRGRLVAHDHDDNGRARYNLGDVLELAAGDAARRESNRAERERRAERMSA